MYIYTHIYLFSKQSRSLPVRLQDRVKHGVSAAWHLLLDVKNLQMLRHSLESVGCKKLFTQCRRVWEIIYIYIYIYVCIYIYTYIYTYIHIFIYPTRPGIGRWQETVAGRASKGAMVLDMLSKTLQVYTYAQCTHTNNHTCIHTCIHASGQPKELYTQGREGARDVG